MKKKKEYLIHFDFNNKNNKELAIPGRKLLKRGLVKMKKDNDLINCELFLCNDFVMATALSKQGGRKLRAKVKLSEPESRIVNTADQSGIVNGFEVNSKRKKYFFIANSPEEKQDWLKELKAAKSVFQLRSPSATPNTLTRLDSNQIVQENSSKVPSKNSQEELTKPKQGKEEVQTDPADSLVKNEKQIRNFFVDILTG